MTKFAGTPPVQPHAGGAAMGLEVSNSLSLFTLQVSPTDLSYWLNINAHFTIPVNLSLTGFCRSEFELPDLLLNQWYESKT